MRTVPPSQTATATIFFTFPQPFVSKGNQVLDEFLASVISMFVILALRDDSNNGANKVRLCNIPTDIQGMPPRFTLVHSLLSLGWR